MTNEASPLTVPSCRLLRAGEQFQGTQAHWYSPGISAESAGARGIHLQIVTIPPGARAKAHKHAAHETAIYALSRVSGMWYGEQLESHVLVNPGDFLYIPADMPLCPTTRVRPRIA
jgi:uncharacterized RmlC-like cupin family protein